MYSRAFIRAHDRTTSNGDIQAQFNGVTAGNDKKNICFEGDPVACPACMSIGVTKCVPPYRRWTGHDGRQVNLDGDLCLCKCSPPPRLKASLTDMIMSFGGQDIVGDAVPWFVDAGHDPAAIGLRADQRFLITDKNTGDVLAGVAYVLECEGLQVEGVTDSDGMTQAIHAKADAQSVTVYLKVHEA